MRLNWLPRFLIFITVLLLTGGILFFGYLIWSRLQTNEYAFQIDAIFSAAEVASPDGPSSLPERAVTAEWNEQRSVVHPGNFKALSYYLKADAAMPLLAHIDKNQALHLCFCGQDHLWAVPAGNYEDEILIRLETGNRSFTIHCRGGNIWPNLLSCSLQGTYHDANILLTGTTQTDRKE